jgi:hypothetical protein
LHPVLTNSLSRIRDTYRSARQKPVATGAAALTVAAVTGVSLGAAFGPSGNVGVASLPAHSVSVSTADQAADGAGRADSSLDHAAASGRPSPADLPRHPAASARLGAKPAPAKHQTAARHAAARPATPRRAPAKPAPRQAPARHPAAPHQAAQHHAAQHHAAPHAVVRHQPKARPAVARRPRPVAPLRPYEIYDSVTPAQIPAHRTVATYATGNYAASPAEVAGRRSVMWIDTTGSDYAASVLDVEPGDATPSLAENWAYHRLSEHRTGLARIYTMISEWPAVKSAVAALPSWMQSHVRWWIADPTGSPHIVPGSSATQWYWGSNYDITSATPHF